MFQPKAGGVRPSFTNHNSAVEQVGSLTIYTGFVDHPEREYAAKYTAPLHKEADLLTILHRSLRACDISIIKPFKEYF